MRDATAALLHDLAKARAVFQQRTLVAIITSQASQDVPQMKEGGSAQTLDRPDQP
jgi:hypothetical protein